MKEAILVVIRFLILILSTLAHLVKFFWIGLTVLPLILLDNWILRTGSETAKLNFHEGIWKYCLDVVYEGDPIYAMIKWVLKND